VKPGFWILIAILVALLGLGLLASKRLEGSPPSVLAAEEIVLGPGGANLVLEIEDPDSGTRSLQVRLLDQAGSRTLAEESYPGDLLTGGAPETRRGRFELLLDPAELRVPDGTATLVISARDWSWRDGFAGNRTQLSIPVRIDTRPPRVEVVSGLTYVHQGGSAAAIYRLGEATARDGIRVDDLFYLGFPHPSGEENLRVALFAIPVEAPANPSVQVVAVDDAGNEAAVRFPARVQKRIFQQGEIEIDDAFVEEVAAPLAERAGLARNGLAETFRSVNETLRARNEATIRQLLTDSPLEARRWSGAFRQLSGSAVMSGFAELRNYALDGLGISKARHYGFDLASTARAPITAAAAGRVVYADDLGIYGQSVLLDHGLGLSSLYAHLSGIEVEAGDDVEQGALLGRSGATGLAGGDHLHFALLVGETYVNPLEWWDPKWVRSHIEARLRKPGP
jgi:murein DD-endopeptidase MepM/ murein hydrolase activator NlpD